MTTRQVTIPELVAALRRRWRRMAVAGGITFALVAAFVFLTPPRYRSDALLRVESRKPTEGLLGSMDELSGMGALGLGRDEVETEIGVLESRRMRDAAIDSLGLEALVTKPRRGRGRSLRITSRDESTLEGTLSLERTDAQHWTVRADWDGDSVAAPAKVQAGTPFTVGPLTFTIEPGATEREYRITLVPRYLARERLDDHLQVRRRSPGAKLIEIRYEDRDPLLTAQVVNVVVSSYLEFMRETESGDASHAIISMRRSSDSVAGALRAADEALRDYQSSARLIAANEQASAEVKRVGVLRGQLDQLEVERDALQRLLTVVDQRSKSGQDAGAYRQLSTFPALISNRAIQDLLGTLVSLETERARLRVHYTDETPSVKSISARIESIERDLRAIGSQYLESIEQQLSETSRALGRLSDQAGSLPTAEMRYVRLARDRTVLGETWVVLQKQLRQAELQDAMRQDRVRLVDPPSVPNPRDPVFPKPAVHLFLGLVLAGLAALAVGLVGLRPLDDEAHL